MMMHQFWECHHLYKNIELQIWINYLQENYYD
jgi:hypothetical protein